MPYRDVPGTPTAPCYRHASSPAETTCVSCLQPICAICLVYDGILQCCAVCQRRKMRLRRLVRAAAALVMLGLLGGGVVYCWKHPERFNVGAVFTRTEDFDYGDQTPLVRDLSAALAKEPCDRQKIVKLAEVMLQAGDNRGALRRSDAFFAACGEHLRLRWTTYTAHQRLSEWDAAIADATRLIDNAPEDPDYWWWRGNIYEEKGALEKAAADYRKTLELRPASNNIPFNLSSVLERLGRPCEAMAPVFQFLRHYPQYRGQPNIVSRMERLGKACPTPPPAP
ncbi:MAG TPA: tetratricopeptide repeat protein [Polyangia bacterium]|jgi:aspartyl protease family protein|nr:tetratricopeptide repeat protein [Polyangia bacterium]